MEEAVALNRKKLKDKVLTEVLLPNKFVGKAKEYDVICRDRGTMNATVINRYTNIDKKRKRKI